MVIALAVLGFLYIVNTWTTSMDETSKQAMNTARTAEASFQKEALSKFTVSPKDIGNPTYESIKSNLEKLVEVNSGVRFAYIYIQKEGKIYFIADSEPVDSKDYSPPGQEYSEADDQIKKPFEDGKPLITQPTTDRWGTWVSMLVPMRDNETGKTIAVFGMDYPAETWNNEAVSKTVKAGAMVFSILLALFAFYIIFDKNMKMKKTQIIIQNSEDRLIAAQQMAHVGNWELNLDTKTLWASEESFNIYGIEYSSQYLPLDIIQRCAFPEYRELLDDKLIGLIMKKEKYDVEFQIKNVKTGQENFVHIIAKLLVDKKGNASKVIGTIQDITESKKKKEEILYLSYHDQLTGVYNRRFYEEELKRLDTKRNLPMTIVMSDVNGLKLINDSFGHDMGDELLRKAAEVIKNGCRADDIIARLGGDEFVIILPKTNGFEAEKIIKCIQDLASKEKVGSLDISIPFGYETKTNEEENIQEVFKNAEDHMYKHKIYESSSTRSKTIDLIINTLYEKSSREMLHSKRVSEICEDIATKMNFARNDVNQIRIAGLMHDIGKIGIDEKILNKPEKLNNDEWTEMKRHPEIGYRILSSVNEFSEIADFVLEHQEYWNGKGYPRGLKGEEISMQARIITVADAFDAMTSNRTYGKALSEEEATNEIRRCSGTQFDPFIARVFIEKCLGKEWE